MYLLTLILLISLFGHSIEINDNFIACGDSIQFKEEKCIEILSDYGISSYDDAKWICERNKEKKSTLLMIESEEEQQFIENLVFNQNKIFESIWLAMKRDLKTQEFNYEGKNNYRYENWAEINNRTNHDCVEMIPSGQFKGKWINTSCKKKNKVVCQKMQNWNFDQLQNEVLRLKKLYHSEVSQLKLNVAELRHNVTQLEINNTELGKNFKQLNDNRVPIGFIYIQLPDQPEPNAIWLNLKWQEITYQYKNSFFRAQGDRTEPFGKVQLQSSPRLSMVNLTYYNGQRINTYSFQENIIPGEWSKLMYTGLNWAPGSGNNRQYINFYVSNEDVRPQNMAIKIWKRIQ